MRHPCLSASSFLVVVVVEISQSPERWRAKSTEGILSRPL
jgi:hypothetical protein